MTLTAGDFAAFYQDVHSMDPFPWQRDLVEQVLTEQRWPDLIDVPTGMGKTSMIDIAVFVAAATARDTGPQRLGRRRCFFVVDRRLVVDEAAEHAGRIADALESARTTILRTVAGELQALAPSADAAALTVTRMRGGTTWAQAWVDRPDLPCVVVGTVDQVGSRLLFRGYGVSDRRKPIDAALVGTDSLLLVDEAHLATALVDTVAAARERDTAGLPLPGATVVLLSATATGSARQPFRLDEAAHRSSPEAWRRLTAAKHIVPVEASAGRVVKVMADTALALALARVDDDSWPPAVLVVCNTVDRAREVHTQLTRSAPARGAADDDPTGIDVDLLIGRSRPFDREELTRDVLRRHGLGRSRGPRPAVLVATQTVEVGVNLDADALVTESASWDALVQRLGRLNRVGRLSERVPRQASAPALVVHDGKADGPVYGEARDITWDHLAGMQVPVTRSSHDSQVGIAAGPLACREITASMPPDASSARPGTPVLQVPTLDAWATTSPVPMVDPPVDVFLHGFTAARAPVVVAWRSGLVPHDDPSAEQPGSAADALLKAVPVRSAEQVEVPFVAFRDWMSGLPPVVVADLDSAPEVDDQWQEDDSFRVLVWRSDRTGQGGARGAAALHSPDQSPAAWEWAESTDVRPGDQVVVPCERGGLDQFGWQPRSAATVRDVSEPASFSGRRPLLRLDAGLARRLDLSGDLADRVTDALRQDDEGEDDLGNVVGVLTAAIGAALSTPERSRDLPYLRQVRAWLTHPLRVMEVPDPSDSDSFVIGGASDRKPLVRLLMSRPSDPDDDGAMASSAGGTPVTLDHHLAAVRDRARGIAIGLGLPTPLVDVVADGAGWHDVGKIEPRFQVSLHGGDSYAALLADVPLAKSGMVDDRAKARLARQRSGLPAGTRHEAWSAALVEKYVTDRPTPYPGDADLLVHLVASHHGNARPWLPLVVDPRPPDLTYVFDGSPVTVTSAATVSLEHPARFVRLNERYGRWGLALLESIVRCADMTVSAEGS